MNVMSEKKTAEESTTTNEAASVFKHKQVRCQCAGKWDVKGEGVKRDTGKKMSKYTYLVAF